MDLSVDTAAILNPIVSNSYYGTLKEYVFFPEHLTIAI